MIKQSEKTESAGRPAAAVAELARANAVLERRLERSSSELAAAQDETGSLAHSISHDLHAPLHVIVGFADLLRKHSAKALDEKGLHYLERITTASAQIGRMMDEILALSQVSICEMHPVPTDLEPLVKGVVHALDATKGERRVIWLIGRLPTVLADPILIRQAFASLASNALAFTRKREVSRIQIGVEAGDGESVFFVRDNGASFSIKVRERMFDSTPGQPGPPEARSGMVSLAHVRRIIQRHGGRLWIEAVPDGGATFHFSLPGELAQPECSPVQR